jgi:hypothetical protein
MNMQDLVGHTTISRLDLYHTQSEIIVVRNQNFVKNLLKYFSGRTIATITFS